MNSANVNYKARMLAFIVSRCPVLFGSMWLPMLLVMSPRIAQAAQAMTPADALDVPATLVVWCGFLAGFSGASALLVRLLREMNLRGVLPSRLWLFCLANLFGSWLAGALAFVISRMQGLDVWGTLGGVIVAAFTGAKFIEMIAEKFMGTKITDAAQPQQGSTL